MNFLGGRSKKKKGSDLLDLAALVKDDGKADKKQKKEKEKLEKEKEKKEAKEKRQKDKR